MTHINPVYDPFSCESWPTLRDIETRRNANEMRHKYVIHDVGRSGNPVLRRGGNDAVRILGRKVLRVTVTVRQQLTDRFPRTFVQHLPQTPPYGGCPCLEYQWVGTGRTAELCLPIPPVATVRAAFTAHGDPMKGFPAFRAPLTLARIPKP